MSSFGSKRKARKIRVDEDEEEQHSDSPSAQPAVAGEGPNLLFSSLADVEKVADQKKIDSTAPATFGARKPFKKSTLRQSMVLNDEATEDTINSQPALHDRRNESDDKAPSWKPSIVRSISTNKKKKPASSRLSFGLGEIISGDAAEALEDDEAFTPKKPTLGRRVVENNAVRKSLPAYSIPIRGGDDDEERPTYSKDYLNQLKSSTPSTPKDLKSLVANVEDEEGLDESELDGAMVVDIEEPVATVIPSEAEIREKRERRARMAKEKDFISLNEGNSDDENRQISVLSRKKKPESRLVRDDEDLGEGFDEFVDDGRISLGKKQERVAKRKQRAAMADLIHEAEGSSSDDSDDSEAERTAAYEATQTRAGMDGLSKPETSSILQVPPKITPIPNLSDCLQRLQTTLSGMQQELAKRNRKMEELQQEKKDILAREQEVQQSLKEAGEKYSALRASTGLPVGEPEAVTTSQASTMFMNRGLESIGNTPVGRTGVEDVG